jgi:hypothetical protein
MATDQEEPNLKDWAQGDWLKISIARGLQGLIALHLEGMPSYRVITKTAGVWYHIMKSWPIDWHEELDRPRLREAFTALAGQSRRWPSPSELRLLMPSRVYPQSALPEPEYPPEKAAENLRRIKTLIKEAFNL